MKQYLPKPFMAQAIGGTYNQALRLLTYWSAVNSAIILVLGWESTMGVFLRSLMPWLTFAWFLVLVVAVAIVVGILDLLFILPAVYAFGNKQATIHANPVYKAIIRSEMKVNRVAKNLNIDVTDIDEEYRDD